MKQQLQRRVARGALTGVVAMAGLGLGSVAASAASASCVAANGVRVTGADAKSICQGISYYHGKTITLVAPDNVGGGFDQYSRAYAPFLAKYLGATVNVINVPAGNTVAGMNFVAGTNRSSTVGLTVGWLNVGPIVEDKILGIPGVQFNAAGEVMLGASAPNLTVTVALRSAACAAYDSGFAGLLASNSAANPVSEPIQTTGSTTFNELVLNGVFGIHYRAIPGYASTTSLLSGWLRGDGCVITAPVSTLGSYIVSGKAVPLVVNVALQSNNQYANYFRGVPTYVQAEKRFARYIKNSTQRAAVPVLNLAGQTSRVLFVPPMTPQNEQSALRAAFAWASGNVNLKLALSAIGAPTGYTTGQVAKSSYLAYLTDARRVTMYLTAVGG